MDKQLLDIYSDYLICSFGLTTATGLSTLLDGAISHDKITRFLSERDFTSADLWHLVKPLIRQIQNEDAVLVVDDNSKCRTALRILLAGYENIEVIGEGCDGQQAVTLTEVCHPDVVIMDINMPKMNGITATGLIKRHSPKTIVIGLSFADDPYLKKAVLGAGASTLISKQEAGEQLYPAINAYWQQGSEQNERSQ